MGAFLLVLLFIIGIVLIILDVRDIVKWRKEKKKKLQQLKEDPGLEQLVKALNKDSVKKGSISDVFNTLSSVDLSFKSLAKDIVDKELLEEDKEDD